MEAIHEERVTAWFTENIEGARVPLRFELIAGGRSNLTFRVTDASGQRFALRRPPLSHVLPTAHDMAREHRVIAALGPTPVPVPPALGYCGDESVNGQPFYVMGFVDGHVLRDATAAAQVLDRAGRRRAGLALADVLVEIHAVDPDAVNLGDLGRREGYIERQLRRWHEQFTQSQALTRRAVPAVEEVHTRLGQRVPPQGPPAIVHGDYRLDNAILGDDGQVLAVLDWEICTLGDPLADVGLLNVYWSEEGEDDLLLVEPPTHLPGFPSREEMMGRYAAGSGRDLGQLDFYVAFGYWKLACILEGVYARYLAGAGGGDPSDFAGYADKVVTLADRAMAVTDRL
jgi:aminoglycoside phosphotransferase (APT) family kinase protein